MNQAVHLTGAEAGCEFLNMERLGLGLANSQVGCSHCHGFGAVRKRGQGQVICGCALRAIFRQAYSLYCSASRTMAKGAPLTMEKTAAGPIVRGYKHAEYRADFVFVAQQTLDDFHYRVFKLRFVAALEWKECLPLLARHVKIMRSAGAYEAPKVDRGNFWHAVYRVEELLGRAYCEVAPYPLFPPSEYFGGHRLRWAQLGRPLRGDRHRASPELAMAAGA